MQSWVTSAQRQWSTEEGSIRQLNGGISDEEECRLSCTDTCTCRLPLRLLLKLKDKKNVGEEEEGLIDM